MSGFLGYNMHSVSQAYSSATDTPQSMVMGPETSDKELVVFFDYGCPACHTAYPLLKRLHKDEPDVRIVLRPFPRMGPMSNKLAGFALAAAEKDKFWDFNNAVIGNDDALNEAKIERILLDIGLNPANMEKESDSEFVREQLDKTFEVARFLNIGGTPTFVVGREIHIYPAEDPTLNDLKGILGLIEKEPAS